DPPLAAVRPAGAPAVLITLGSGGVGTGGYSAVAGFVRTPDRRVIVQGASGPVLAEAAPHRVFAAGVDQVIGDAGFSRRAARIGARLEDGDSTAPLRRWAAEHDG